MPPVEAQVVEMSMNLTVHTSEKGPSARESAANIVAARYEASN
jgi:hypothetical protein